MLQRTALCVLLATLAPNATAQPVAPKGPDPAAFRVAKVERGDLARVLTLDGALWPEKSAALRPQVSGVVAKLLVREGDQVEVGQVLVQLDDRVQALALELARVQVARARGEVQAAEAQQQQLEAQRRLAETSLERARRLLENKVVPPDEVEQLRSQVEAVRARLVEGQARIEDARIGVKLAEVGVRKSELDLEATRLLAPFGGVVAEVNATVGETVAPGAGRLVLLVSLPNPLVFRATLEAGAGRQVRPGTTLKVEGVATRVERVVPVFRDGEEAPRLAIEARVPNADGQLSAFRQATAQVPLGTVENALRVPAAALKWRPLPEEVEPAAREAYREFRYEPQPADGPGLVVVLVEGRLRPVKVEVLATSGAVAAVRGPLKEGDTVVVGRKGLE